MTTTAAPNAEHRPATLAIGPVLHPDDAVANKVCALYSRAQARDYIDIDAVLRSGRYSGTRGENTQRRNCAISVDINSVSRELPGMRYLDLLWEPLGGKVLDVLCDDHPRTSDDRTMVQL